MRRFRRLIGAASVVFAVIAAPGLVVAQTLPGVTDTEIRIGNIVPYTGPAAAWGELGRVYAAFFEMINDLGGINGRLVTFISGGW